MKLPQGGSPCCKCLTHLFYYSYQFTSTSRIWQDMQDELRRRHRHRGTRGGGPAAGVGLSTDGAAGAAMPALAVPVPCKAVETGDFNVDLLRVREMMVELCNLEWGTGKHCTYFIAHIAHIILLLQLLGFCSYIGLTLLAHMPFCCVQGCMGFRGYTMR